MTAVKERTLLIVDRNPNVRGYLKREMEQEGYRIHTAESFREALDWLDRNDPVDLVVIDLDLSDTEKCQVLETLCRRFPTLPAVVHTFASVYAGCESVLPAHAHTVFVEKKGNSIESLKKVARDILESECATNFPG